MLTTRELFDLKHSLAGPYLASFPYPWEALGGIGELILSLGRTLSPEEYDHPSENVWIAKDVIFRSPLYCLQGPCIIGHQADIRPFAFIRDNVLIGDRCVVGNSTELKNTILFDDTEVPHYNYVGDSILGYHVHLGAGAITSNFRNDGGNVIIRDGSGRADTGRDKVGAFLGDRADVGCNSVLNPGTVLGRGCRIYPLSSVRGTVPAYHIYKDSDHIIPITEKTT
ncbi:MAG: UDP-N-acetylglucosamine pyrophosphorylase [Lachnospiraceae bacterium]|nr:UDP-N-acetylglucosamine pyrophosphorylase [Lachnospiraceae bacterium]